MRRTVWLIAVVGALLVAGALKVEAADGAAMKWKAVELSMKPRADDPAPAWRVRLQADGAGTYSESGVTAATMPLTVGQETLQRVRLGEHAAKSGKCETKAKKIAQTGEKTIRFEELGKVAECTFNYSDDQGLMDAIAAFQAVAETMQRGERLQHDLRYDRLGLDAEMESLVEAKQSGSAIEIGNLTPILQALIEDDHVIDRVRRRAARLLQDAGSSVPAGYDPSER
jgi:hypothetical protein